MTHLEEIEKKGWAEVEGIQSESEFFELALGSGSAIKHPDGKIINDIIPKLPENSLKGTLSNSFGFGEFPLHTDTAYWSKPARYVFLWSPNESKASTLLINNAVVWNGLSQQEMVHAMNSTFLLQTIHGKHYTSALFKNGSENGLRYDPCIMTPINKSAQIFEDALTKTLKSVQPFKANWTGNKVLIFDNWKTLHGRMPTFNDPNRVLKRIYIDII